MRKRKKINRAKHFTCNFYSVRFNNKSGVWEVGLTADTFPHKAYSTFTPYFKCNSVEEAIQWANNN